MMGYDMQDYKMGSGVGTIVYKDGDENKELTMSDEEMRKALADNYS
jgi:hypothetical protein